MLVADDDPALRLLCRVNLEHEGYDVGEAASAEQVADALAVRKDGVILLDIHLGADDGLDVARRLRNHGTRFRIAFFSGSAGEVVGEDALLADAVIPKPFSLEALIGTVRSLASR